MISDMPDMIELSKLTTEQRNPRTMHIDEVPTLELVRLINDEDKRVPLAVERILPDVARAVDLVAAALAAGGRLFYLGAGTSGRLGILDAVECPPTYRTDPERIVGLIGEITNIVRLVGHIEYDKDSLAYYRFVTHLKFFAKRMFTGKQHPGEEIDEDMAQMIATKYALAHDCVGKVAAFLKEKYGYDVSEDEKFYLTIHVAKVIKQSMAV